MDALRVTFGAIGAIDLVTRPDFVFPRMTGGLLSTAGACASRQHSRSQPAGVGGEQRSGKLTIGAVLRGRLALAFGLLETAGADFSGAALAVVAFFVAPFFAVVLDLVVLVAALTGTMGAGLAIGLDASFLASFTGPDGPEWQKSAQLVEERGCTMIRRHA